MEETAASAVARLALGTRLGTAPGTAPGVPTGSPSGVPTGSPSGVPAGSPSGVPAGSPSGVPAGSPSGVAADSPSGVPAGYPSGVPAGTPSGVALAPPSVPMTAEAIWAFSDAAITPPGSRESSMVSTNSVDRSGFSLCFIPNSPSFPFVSSKPNAQRFLCVVNFIVANVTR